MGVAARVSGKAAPPVVGGNTAIFYRANGDSPSDRRNIKLLEKVVAKATTQVSAEIFYHLPRRLSDWTNPADGIRYTRIRNSSEWPIAERIAKLQGACVLIFDGTLLLSASDVWYMIGYAQQHERVLLQARRAVRGTRETCLHFAMREANLHLQHRVWERTTDATAVAFKVAERDPRSIRVLTDYAEQLRAIAHADFFTFYGNSRAIGSHSAQPLLASVIRTMHAVKAWRNDGRFPSSYSQKTLLFHVAQLAAYSGAIFAFVSLPAGLIVLGFAVCITPRFFLTGISLLRPVDLVRRVFARFALYYVG